MFAPVRARSLKADLHRRRRRPGPGPYSTSCSLPGLTAKRGTAALAVWAERHPQDRVHDEHDREPAHADPQDDQDARPLPQRRRRTQTDLAGNPTRQVQLAHLFTTGRPPWPSSVPRRRPHPRQHLTTRRYTEKRAGSFATLGGRMITRDEAVTQFWNVTSRTGETLTGARSSWRNARAAIALSATKERRMSAGSTMSRVSWSSRFARSRLRRPFDGPAGTIKPARSVCGSHATWLLGVDPAMRSHA
jgi:hypothetical protein